MPDLIVKGMKLPVSCVCCPLNHGERRPEYGWTVICQYSNGVVRIDPADPFNLLPTCELLEIRTHGDLVERDEIIAQYDAEHVGPPGRAREIMQEARTIVPSNKEVSHACEN